MASAPPPSEMEQEAKCPICLEFLTDPVVLGCGHSFCQGCITDYCEKWETLGDLECPTCKFKFQKGVFCRNWQLANLVDKIKLMPLSLGKEDLCLRHKEKLHFFCKEDEELMCFVCEGSPEHQGHTVLLLEEAARLHKDKFFNCLKTLRTEKEEVLAALSCVENESREMLKRTASTRQQTVAEFRILHQLLEEHENDLLALIEETEKEVARKKDEHLAKLSEKVSSLESLIQEMEEKLQQPVSELLQDVRGTLQRYEKREKFEKSKSMWFRIKEILGKKKWFPEAFPSELKYRVNECLYNPFLKSAMKQFEDILVWAFPKLREDVILDKASASSGLILTSDWKSMTWKSTAQDFPQDPKEHCGFVLGSEGFTTGCHFWEVHVEIWGDWAVGVARKLEKSGVTLTPSNGIWAVGRWKGQHKAFKSGTDPPLTLSGELKRIRVCLNYDGGQVAFFDADRAALLYKFSGAAFCGETLYPFFAMYSDGRLRLLP